MYVMRHGFEPRCQAQNLKIWFRRILAVQKRVMQMTGKIKQQDSSMLGMGQYLLDTPFILRVIRDD